MKICSNALNFCTVVQSIMENTTLEANNLDSRMGVKILFAGTLNEKSLEVKDRIVKALGIPNYEEDLILLYLNEMISYLKMRNIVRSSRDLCSNANNKHLTVGLVIIVNYYVLQEVLECLN